MDGLERFAVLVRGPDAALPLDEAALLVAAHARALDVDAGLAEVDELAAGCRTPTLDGLRRHLFRDLGFGGNTDDYYEPANSYLDQVVARRTGIPITLSLLTMEVGRRLGVPLSGVGMPGHFLLRDKVDPEVFVDPFARGEVLDRHGCERRFRMVNGPGVPFDDSFLDPVSRLAIVGRMLTNLESIFLASGERDSLVWVLRLKAVLPGAEATEVRKLVSVLTASGAYDRAADELDRLVAVLTGEDAEDAHHHALRLRARLN
jgi:regulator of sirC expression with transglutaminase-like and TPR domain